MVQLAHDLNNRLEIIKFEANPIEKVRQLLVLGEVALNIEVNVKDEIAESANGSFYIAQMLSRILAHASTQAFLKSNPTRSLLRSVLNWSAARSSSDCLEFSWRDNQSARNHFDAKGRAPYLHLLYWLAKCDDWSLSTSRAIRENQSCGGIGHADCRERPSQ